MYRECDQSGNAGPTRLHNVLQFTLLDDPYDEENKLTGSGNNVDVVQAEPRDNRYSAAELQLHPHHLIEL